MGVCKYEKGPCCAINRISNTFEEDGFDCLSRNDTEMCELDTYYETLSV